MSVSLALVMTAFVAGLSAIGVFAVGGMMFDTDAVKFWRFAFYALGGVLAVAAVVMVTMSIWWEVAE